MPRSKLISRLSLLFIAFSLVPEALFGQRGAPRQTTPADAIDVPNGFKIELLRPAQPNEGSWVAMTVDNKGRLIVSPQHARASDTEGGLLRFTMGADGQIANTEVIAKPLYDAQVLLYALDSLYVVVNHYTTKFASGLYRLTETADGQFSEPVLLRKFQGQGEHG